MIGYTSGLRGGGLQGLVNRTEVIPSGVERDRCGVVLKLLTERILPERLGVVPLVQEETQRETSTVFHRAQSPSGIRSSRDSSQFCRDRKAAGGEGTNAFFTPEHDGLYRVTFFIGQTDGALPCKCVEVSLIVANGAPLFDLAQFVEGGTTAVSAFSAVAGQPIGYYTALTPIPLPSPYDLFIVIEEL